MTCDYLHESSVLVTTQYPVLNGVATTENNLCFVLVSIGEVVPSCFQASPSNSCPVAKYSRGEISLEEAKKLLDSQKK